MQPSPVQPARKTIEAYFQLPKETLADRLIMRISLGIFIFIVCVLWWQTQDVEIHRTIGEPFSSRCRAYINCILATGVLAIVIPAIVAGGMWFGIWVAVRIRTFRQLPSVHWHCIAASCAIFSALFVVKILGLTGPAALLAFIVALVSPMVVLWFSLRVRPTEFAILGGLAALMGMFIPLVLFTMLFLILRQQDPSYQLRLQARAAAPSQVVSEQTRAQRRANARLATEQEMIQLLNWLALKDLNYAIRHDGQYARNLDELQSIKPEFFPAGAALLQKYPVQFVEGTPPIATLPRDLIIAYIVEPDGTGYRVLFGDWHVDHVESTQWKSVKSRSAHRLHQLQKDTPAPLPQ